jgi:hypothetical protein
MLIDLLYIPDLILKLYVFIVFYSKIIRFHSFLIRIISLMTGKMVPQSSKSNRKDNKFEYIFFISRYLYLVKKIDMLIWKQIENSQLVTTLKF